MQIRTFLFYCLAILFIFTPFQKGLYFDGDFYLIELIISFLFLLVVLFTILNKASIMPNYTALLVILPIVLAISLFKAETPLGGINQFIRWTCYCCFFYLMYFVALERKYRDFLVYLVQVSGLVLILFSMSAYTGIVSYPDAVIAGRLAGVLQYPNSFAALLGLLLLFSLVLLSKEKLTKWEPIFYGLPIIPYIVGFLLTGSRAALLIFPFVWLVGLGLLSFKQQIYYLFYTITSFLLSLIISIAFSNNIFLVIITVLVSLLFVGFICILKTRFEGQKDRSLLKYLEKFTFHSYLLPLINGIVILFAILDLFYWKLFFSWLPGFIKDRIQTVSFTNDTFKERMIIAKDAIKASKDSLLLGYGGDGWSVVFTKFQSLPYQTKSLHNGILEWLINAGVIGLLAFLLLFGYYFFMLLKKRGKEKRNHVSMAVFVSLLFVFLHSLLDFNLSFGTIWFFVFTLLAIGLSNNEVKSVAKQSKNILNKVSFCLLLFFSIVMLFFAFRFNASDRLFQQVQTEQSVNNKLIMVEKSIQYNQYDIDKWNTLGLLYAQFPKQESRIVTIVSKMKKLEPNNSKVSLYAVNLLEKSGLYLNADKLVDSSLQHDFYNPPLRQESIRLKTNLALIYLKQKNDKKAAAFAKAAENQYDQFVSDTKDLSIKLPNKSFNSRHFHINEDAQFYGALSAYLNKDFNKAMEIAKKTGKSKNQEVRLKSLALENLSISKLNLKPEPDLQNKQYLNNKEYQLFIKELENI